MTRDIEALIDEDVPSIDLSTLILGCGDVAARIVFTSRQAGVASGLELAQACFPREWVGLDYSLAGGASIEAGQRLLELHGPAKYLHRGWKSALSLLEYASAVATRTRAMVDAAYSVRPDCAVFGTRKNPPGSRFAAITGLIDGGAMPHRLGLSETILIFDQHKGLFPDRQALLGRLRAMRHLACEKKVIVEVADLDEARDFAESGLVDGIQFDKVDSRELTSWVRLLRSGGFSGTLIAAGGIKAENAADYAGSGVNALASSWMYAAPPMDMTASIFPDRVGAGA